MIDEAATARDLARSLKAERKLRADSEAANAQTSADLAKAEATIRATGEKAARVIRVVVPDNRACDIPAKAVKAINCARGYAEDCE